MASTTVLISSTSREQIFVGNLMKAPPLNRRGRKKWHDRYFILRANKTLECYKTKKAAVNMKTPRRIIDLRECINLEVGLEYKNLSHIMSLGTFKRTFFMAAPSDALMLQWANVLEKTKSAREGSSIEVLDIGLRRSRDPKLVHGVKPSQSTNQLIQKQSIYSNGKQSKSQVALANFMRHSNDLQIQCSSDGQEDASSPSDRESQSTSSMVFVPVNKAEGGSDFQPLGSPHSWVEGSQEGRYCRGYARNFKRLPLGSESSEEASSILSTPQEPMRNSSGISPTGQTNEKNPPSMLRRKMVVIPNKVPPPNMAQRRAGLTFDASGDQSDYVNVGAMATGVKEFVAKEGVLHRGTRPLKVQGTKVKGGSNPKKRSKKHSTSKLNTTPAPSASSLPPGGKLSGPGGSSTTIFHSNMKRSFRYRKITLRPEKPLFAESATADNSSDDETETENESACGSHSKTPELRMGTRPKPAPVTINEDDIKKIGPNFGNFGINPLPSATRRYATLSTSRPTRYLYKSKANSYSKITVGRKHDLVSQFSAEQLEPAVTRSLEVTTSPIEFTVSPSDETNQSLVPVPTSPEWNHLQLPARFPSDPYLYSSMSSLDNILVDPPEMFNTAAAKVEENLEKFTKQGGGGAIKLPVVSHTHINGDRSSKGLISGSHDKRRVSGPTAHTDVLTMSGVMIMDRNSTESCDTGYTSASPGYGNNTSGYHDNRGDKTQEYNEPIPSQLHLKHTLPTEDHYDPRSITPPLGFEASHVKSQTSITSGSSSDSIRREYVPLVFHSDSIGRGHQGSFSVQVCLVENSEELIKDLIALKLLESYQILDCEELQGTTNMAAFGDDFTVATALEDLEFGFSIVRSSQKDIFQRKVREFSFELRDLFGSAKPFSCDVEIRHADQIIILPIEIERSRS